MATSTTHLDHTTLETQIFEITRQLLTELGSHQVNAIRGSAHLDRDLGLGSLERVELLIRLDRAFGCHLPERVLAEASTLAQVVTALAETLHTADKVPEQAPRARRQPSPSPAQPEQPAEPPASAETWQQVLQYRALEDTRRTHLVLWNDDGEPQRISFGELYSCAQVVAGQLTLRGITRGDSVALMLPTCRDFFVAYAGILLAGGVPVPIYPPVRSNRIAEYAARQSAILRNAEARLLITFEDASRLAKLLARGVQSLREVVTAAELVSNVAPPQIAAARASGITPPGTATDLALLQYTSGSTGDPKGVMLTHANLLANVRAIGEAAAIQPNDVGVSWLPLYHDMGLIGTWLTPLYFGLSVVVLSPLAFLSRPENWLWAIHNSRATLTAAPNFAYELAARKIADSQIEGLNLGSLRAALNGAEPVNAETLDRFATRFARFGLHREVLTPVYGLAEASLAVTIPPVGRGPVVDRIERDAFTKHGRALPVAAEAQLDAEEILSVVSVGRVLPGHELRITETGGGMADERTEGAIWFRGPSATSGYFRNAEASNGLFPEGRAPGWLDSGDRGYLAGGELFVTGRVKDIIVKAGRNLHPHEIEEIAGRVAGVRKGCVAAFGAADAATGTERLVIAAETRERDPAARHRIAAEVTEKVASGVGLPPDTIELVPPHSIPKTSSGKLRRDETRKIYLAGRLGNTVAPVWVQLAGMALRSGVHAAKSWLRRAAEVLYGIYALLVFVPWLAGAWVMVSFAPNRRMAADITSPALRSYLALIGCRVEVSGLKYWHIAGPRIIVSNHTSYFDVPLLMAVLGIDYHFVAKYEVHRMPLIGTFLRKLGHFAFDRSNPQAHLQQAEQIEETLREGESVFVFPEGTFTAQPGVRPFQLGAFKAAASLPCPVLPVALKGIRRFLPDGSFLPRPSHITITICPPLEPATLTSGVEPGAQESTTWQEIVRLRDAARTVIARESGEPLL